LPLKPPPTPGLVQPVAAEDIARALTDIAESGLPMTARSSWGPDPVRRVDLVERILRAQHDARRAKATPEALYYGSQLDDKTSCPAPA
jgi:hypothetical protein